MDLVKRLHCLLWLPIITCQAQTSSLSLSVTPLSPVVGQEVTFTCTASPDITTNTQVQYIRNTKLVGTFSVNSTSCFSVKERTGFGYTFTCGSLPVRQLSLTIPAAYVTEDESGTIWACSSPQGAMSNNVQVTLRGQTPSLSLSLSVTPLSPVVGQEVTFTCTASPDITTNTQVQYIRNTKLVGTFSVNSTSCFSVKERTGFGYTFTCGSLPVRQLSLTIPAAYVTEDENGTLWACSSPQGAISNNVQVTLSDVDECATSPCQFGGTCINEHGSYTCICPVGRTGQNCMEGKLCPAADTTLFDAGLAMLCTGVVALLLTIGIVVTVIKRKDTGLGKRTAPPVHLRNMDYEGTPRGNDSTRYETLTDGTVPKYVYKSIGIPSNENGTSLPGDDRTLYETIDDEGTVPKYVYERGGIPSNDNDSTADRQQGSGAYERLHGRSPNTYEELV